MGRLTVGRAACVATALLLGSLVAVPGCSRDPQVRKQKYFDRGEAAFKAGQYREAVLAYKNAISIDGRFGRAYYRLGEAEEKLENGTGAMGAFVRAADLMPADTEAQLRAANYLIAARRYEDARTRALSVVAREPKNVEALILVGNASAGLNDLDAAVRQLQEAMRLDPSDPRAYNNLGWFQALRGNREEAERVFRDAVALAPNSADPHLALANYLLAVGRREDAEQSLRTATSLAPRSVAANRALGWVLAATNRMGEAEPYFVAVATNDPQPAGRFLLADFYASAGRDADAAKVLEVLRKDPRAGVDADTRLAASLYRRGDLVRANELLKEALAKSPRNVEARLLSADVALKEHHAKDALAIAQAVLADDARNPAAHFVAGKAFIALGRSEEAKEAFSEVVRLNPRATTARLFLARLNLMAGDATTARQLADEVLRVVPGNPGAQLLIAETTQAQGDSATAGRIVEALAAAYPNWVSPQAQISRLAVARGDWARAQQAIDRVEALSPDSPEAFEGRLAIAVGTRRPDLARQQIEVKLAREPRNRRALLVAAQAYAGLGSQADAEAVLKRLLALDPSNLAAYDLLGQVYYASGRVAEAEKQFEAMAAQEPKSVYPLTVAAVLAHAQGHLDVARQRYEKVVALDPQAAVAANNLAWLYVEQGGNLDVALQLAQAAKREAPASAEFSDTLGVILSRKGLWPSAIRELKEAVALAPKNATVQFHLAQAYLGAGDKKAARLAAERALRLDPAFAESGMARSMIGALGGDTAAQSVEPPTKVRR